MTSKTLFMRSFFFAFLALMLCVPASAQRSFTYRFTSFGGGSLDGKGLVNSKLGGDIVKVTEGFVSPPATAALREEKFLDFFDENQVSETDKPIFSVPIPAGTQANSVVLLMQDGDKLTARLLDLKAKKIRRGEELIMNQLSTPIAVRFSDGEGKKWSKPTVIRPGGEKVIKPPQKQIGYKEISAQDPKTKRFKPFVKGVGLATQKGSRLGFCYQVKKGERPKISYITIHDVKQRPKIN